MVWHAASTWRCLLFIALVSGALGQSLAGILRSTAGTVQQELSQDPIRRNTSSIDSSVGGSDLGGNRPASSGCRGRRILNRWRLLDGHCYAPGRSARCRLPAWSSSQDNTSDAFNRIGAVLPGLAR